MKRTPALRRDKKTSVAIPILIVALVLTLTYFVELGGTFSSLLRSDRTHTTAAAPDADYADRAFDNTWPGAGAMTLNGDLQQVNYYLVLDGSGSMADEECAPGSSKLEVAQRALADFVGRIPNDANIGLFVFDGTGVRERVSLGTDNRSLVTDAISKVRAAKDTPLRVALEVGYAALTTQGRKQLGYGEYHLVVVTDGHASRGYDPRRTVDRLLRESPVVLHTIGFCIHGEHVLNQHDRAYYRAADDPSSLLAALDDVLAEEPDFQMTRFDGANR